MPEDLVSGVYAAVTIPRRVDGTIDESSLAKSLEFLVSRGIQGFALNGATGEYCLTSPEELQKILALAKGLMTGSRKFVCGIGSGSIRGSLDRGKIAMEAGAIAVLLPMPFFYPYAQDDLDTFCREVAGQLSIPILLYNLPQFTSALAPSTVRSLITECPNIIGIKDSSGNLDILRMLSHEGIDACRIVGNDGVLAAALREVICEGVISGVAGVMPELILSLFQNLPETNEFLRAARLLDEFIQHVDAFPTPWGLKWISEFRGIAPADFSQPLSPCRLEQSRAMREWFQVWQATAGLSG